MKLIISFLLLMLFASSKIQSMQTPTNKINALLFKLYCKENIRLYVQDIFNVNKRTQEDENCYNLNFAFAPHTKYREIDCNNEKSFAYYDLNLRTLADIYNTYGEKPTIEILKFSGCKDEQKDFDNFKFPLSKMIVSLNMFSKATDQIGYQFYDKPNAITLYEDGPYGVTLEFIVQKMNEFTFVPEDKILLDQNRDLEIESIAILKRKFTIGYHEILALCTRGKTRKHFFVAHRGREEGSTRVKIIYYKSADLNADCTQFSPEKIDKNSIFIEAKDNKDKSFKYNSMRTFIQKSMEYTIKYYDYAVWSINCQHYATGLYNGVTGLNKETTNPNICSRKPILKKKLRNQSKNFQ